MQRRVAVFIGGALPPAASLPLSNLVDVVTATRAFMGVGEAFAGTDSHGLRAALHAKVRAPSSSAVPLALLSRPTYCTFGNLQARAFFFQFHSRNFGSNSRFTQPPNLLHLR